MSKVKKIKPTSNTGIKIIDSIKKIHSHHTWIVGSNSTKSSIIKDLLREGPIIGEIKFLDTQGRITFLNNDKQIKLWNDMINEFLEYSELTSLEELSEFTDEDKLNLVKDYISEQEGLNESEQSFYNQLQKASESNQYIAKLLKSFSKGKKIKTFKISLQVNDIVFTQHLLPESNDTIIIFNIPSLPKIIDTDLLTNIINNSNNPSINFNIILIEDKKGGTWKLSKLFENKFNFISETKKKLVYNTKV